HEVRGVHLLRVGEQAQIRLAVRIHMIGQLVGVTELFGPPHDLTGAEQRPGDVRADRGRHFARPGEGGRVGTQLAPPSPAAYRPRSTAFGFGGAARSSTTSNRSTSFRFSPFHSLAPISARTTTSRPTTGNGLRSSAWFVSPSGARAAFARFWFRRAAA